MDKVAAYREAIKKALNWFVDIDHRQPNPQGEVYLIADEKSDDYILMELGWQGDKKIQVMRVFARIRNGKIYIEEDWTEDGIADDLLDTGVPKEDIVLAFHPPNMRQYTEFAAA